MIEINLLPGPKKKKRGGLALPDFRELAASIKDPMLLAAVGALGASALFIALVWGVQRAKVESLRPVVGQLRVNARNLRTVIAEKRRMEVLRDSLTAELEAIREIDRDRYVWPHILDEITRALPDYTWLVNLDYIPAPPPIDGTTDQVRPAVRFSIEGRTSDIQAYTRFYRQLGDSPWFRDLRLGATQTVQEADRPITSFQIEGTYQMADSAFIRTIPVTEAVR